MARGNPPPLPDDAEAMVKPAHDEVAAIRAADPIPTPVVTPPSPTPVVTPPPPAAQPDYTQQPQPAYTPAPQVTIIDNNMGGMNNNMGQMGFMQNQATAQAQAQASVGLAQTSIDKEIVEKQFEKEDEHWVKAFWRPAMGWLYMLICFMDFVGFPMLTIFLPIIFKPFGLVMPYTAWTSLTLSNGGLIHLAFGAILGVSAFTRGQEKIAGKS